MAKRRLIPLRMTTIISLLLDMQVGRSSMERQASFLV